MALAIARTLEHTGERPQPLIASALEGSSESDREKLVAIAGDAVHAIRLPLPNLLSLISAISDIGRNSTTEDDRSAATETCSAPRASLGEAGAKGA